MPGASQLRHHRADLPAPVRRGQHDVRAPPLQQLQHRVQRSLPGLRVCPQLDAHLCRRVLSGRQGLGGRAEGDVLASLRRGRRGLASRRPRQKRPAGRAPVRQQAANLALRRRRPAGASFPHFCRPPRFPPRALRRPPRFLSSNPPDGSPPRVLSMGLPLQAQGSSSEGYLSRPRSPVALFRRRPYSSFPRASFLNLS